MYHQEVLTQVITGTASIMEGDLDTLGQDLSPDIQDQVLDPLEDQTPGPDHPKDIGDTGQEQDQSQDQEKKLTSCHILNHQCMIEKEDMMTPAPVPQDHHHHHHHQLQPEHPSIMEGYHPFLQTLLEVY